MAEVLACTRYWLAVLIRSQRYFPPLVLVVVGVIVLTANDGGPLVGSYGASAAVLFLAAVWLTIALLGAEAAEQRAVTVTNVGSSARVLCGAVLAAATGGVFAVGYGLVFPAVGGHHLVTAPAVLTGAMIELCAVLTGIAIGLLCSRLVVQSTPLSLALALALVLVAYLLPWITPLHTALRVSDRSEPPGHLLPAAAGLAGVSVAVLLVIAAITQYVAVRRD